MHKPTNIRNISVIAHVDHGKSTLTDSLLAKAGLLATSRAGGARGLDTRADEQARGITIKSTAVSMHFTIDKDLIEDIKQPVDGANFLINLIDSPGHVDFSSEVTAALRVTDGALVVVDCVSSVCVQTETVLLQALSEQIRPVFMLNKLDRAIVGLQLGKEDLYLSLAGTIDALNGVLETHEDSALGDVRAMPEIGNVAFGAGIQGWAFTLRQFARMYARAKGGDPDKLVKKLWGDHFYDPKTRKIIASDVDAEGNKLERTFCKFILDPIYRIFDAAMSPSPATSLPPVLSKLSINLPPSSLLLPTKDLLKHTLSLFLPASSALLHLIIPHLPSPVAAQKYRVSSLYEGPMDDECAQGIRGCDADAPLMVYVSKMVPTSDRGRFYALGRVFSGTVKSGMKVRVLGPNFVPGGKSDLFAASVQRTVLMMGGKVEPIDSCPAGSIVGLVGVDQFLLKSGTITTSESAHNLRVMKFSVSPVVQVAVEVEKQSDLPKLIEGLKRLSKSDPCILTTISETGEHIVSGAGELHLEISLADLQATHAGVTLKISKPVVNFRESVLCASSSRALSKSANRHNRVWATADPLGEELSRAIEEGKVGPRDDPKVRASVLGSEFGWETAEAKKLWCFGPDEGGPNVLVDGTVGVQYLAQVKDSIVAGFQWASKQGPCTEEPMRGVRFNIMDITLHADSVHRGGDQIMPMARRVIYGATLLANPTLHEPVYLIDIQFPASVLGAVYSTLSRNRGRVFSEEMRHGTQMYNLKAYLPVRASFGFMDVLKGATGGKAFAQLVFDHWDAVPEGAIMEAGTPGEALALSIRRRKGLTLALPLLETFVKSHVSHTPENVSDAQNLSE
ncbi:hypothetical protein RQP46_009820 [Phenoliferia psychrophenolica]